MGTQIVILSVFGSIAAYGLFYCIWWAAVDIGFRRDLSPLEKFGWCLTVFFMPVAGSLVYYLFGWRRQEPHLHEKAPFHADEPL